MSRVSVQLARSGPVKILCCNAKMQPSRFALSHGLYAATVRHGTLGSYGVHSGGWPSAGRFPASIFDQLPKPTCSFKCSEVEVVSNKAPASRYLIVQRASSAIILMRQPKECLASANTRRVSNAENKISRYALTAPCRVDIKILKEAVLRRRPHVVVKDVVAGAEEETLVRLVTHAETSNAPLRLEEA